MYNYGTTQGYQTLPTTSYNPYLAQHALNGIPAVHTTIGQVAAGLNTIGGVQGINSFDAIQMLARIEAQLGFVTELLRLSTSNVVAQQYGQLNGLTQWQTQGRAIGGVQVADVNPIRLRESDSAIYCELFLATLTVGDVEVEVNGNRVICRTLVPFAQINRWYSVSTMPRGFEFFELPDGRVEFSWTCPVSFVAKDIEAAFREGFLCISIPKTHVATTAQKVKVAKEPIARVQ